MNKPCVLCGGRKYKKKVSTSLLKIYECRKCGLYRVPQRPKNLHKTGDYFQNYNLDKYISYYEGFRKEIYRKNWRQIRKWKSTGRSLDFGSSFGWFLEIAPKGWDVYGIEPAQIALTCKKKGLKVLQGDEKDIKKFKTSFHLVTMWNVIEHLSDPPKTLRLISEQMTRDAIFAIAFPNRYGFYNQLAYFLYYLSFGLIAKPLHVLFQADNPVPHLHHFRISDIESVLEATGFKIIKFEPQRIIDAKNLGKRQEVQSSVVLKYIAVPTLFVLDKVLDFIHLNKDELVVYARRK